VLSLHSLRPFDEAAVRQAVERSRAVITVEEHSVNGGLGSRVASFLMQAGVFRPLRIVGIPDEHTVAGSQGEIFRHYGISQQGLAQIALGLLENLKETK
jgi:transketolase